MSCTLKELQMTEYEILCKFVDFCEENSLYYVLDYGTLLGAVRHDGFIPWDDDIDVIMDYRSFKKFIRLVKKNPIPGLHLTWIDTEPYAQYPFAKLRKDGTHMPEPSMKGIEDHDGVWIDIFAYFGLSKFPHVAALQMQFYLNYIIMGNRYRDCILDKAGKSKTKHDYKYKLITKLPKWILVFLRKLSLFLATFAGSNNSENVQITWWYTEKSKGLKRKYYEPSIKHIFEEREFNIPENYDMRLRHEYGEYMTPAQPKIHSNLDNIIL